MVTADTREENKMTTPQAILTGFALVALAIASLLYNTGVIPKAQAMPSIELIMMTNQILDGQQEILMELKSHHFVAMIKMDALYEDMDNSSEE